MRTSIHPIMLITYTSNSSIYLYTLCHTLQFTSTLYAYYLVLDFRLMEAMASGALILVDRMSVPRPYALIEGTHIVYYGESSNSSSLFFYMPSYILSHIFLYALSLLPF